MFNISNFFQKFSKIQADSAKSSEKVVTAVKNASGLIIESKDFALNNGVLRFVLNPVIKNEIFMRKQKILSELNSSGYAVRDIR